MTLVIDIDGVLAVPINKYSSGCYLKSEQILNAHHAVASLKSLGYKIILYTARPEIDREDTANWLDRNLISYDELVMDKPLGDLYIDDKALKFDNWADTYKRIIDETA